MSANAPTPDLRDRQCHRETASGVAETGTKSHNHNIKEPLFFLVKLKMETGKRKIGRLVFSPSCVAAALDLNDRVNSEERLSKRTTGLQSPVATDRQKLLMFPHCRPLSTINVEEVVA